MSTRSPLIQLSNTPLTPQRTPKSPSASRSTINAINSPTPNLLNFGEIDEGRQKKTLRRKSGLHNELQRKNLGSTSSSTSTTDSPRQNEVLNGLTTTQLASHYSDCIKLSTENKINSKNAFGLHLIDYMTELVKKKEMENFQVASSTLDASVKIYAGRVDFIHSHTYKVLSGLGGNQAKGKDDQEDDAGDPDNPAIDDPDAPKKKKKKSGKVRTIETNLNNITADKVDLGFEVDPMFQMMSAAFDEGGASGLLLNRLRCYDDSQSLILDSSTTVNVVEDVEDNPPQETRKTIDTAALKELISNVKLEEKNICPSLMDFKFTDWDKDMSIIQKQFSDFAFDPTAAPTFPEEPHQPSVEEEADAIAHESIDDADDDIENNSLTGSSDSIIPGDMQTAEFVDSAFRDLTEGSVGKLRQILAMQPSDYSYFNKVLMQTWAGPSHWKLNNAARKVTSSSDSTVKNKRTKKAPLWLEFTTTSTEGEKCLKLSKATSVTQATWAKYTKKKTTLPDDQMLDSKEGLFRIFHRPNMMIKLQERESISSVDDGMDNYDYNNKNDMENFCPLPRDDGDSYDESGGFDISGDGIVPGSHVSEPSVASEFDGTVLTQDKLVAAPHKVQKLDIKYAKAAKRVDVRKLKSTMWNILTNKEQTEEMTPVPLPSSQGEVDHALPQTFSELKEKLPAKVSSGMAKNLTIQTVFACLLYLTNEKTLKLATSEDMDDISIEQDLS